MFPWLGSIPGWADLISASHGIAFPALMKFALLSSRNLTSLSFFSFLSGLLCSFRTYSNVRTFPKGQ